MPLTTAQLQTLKADIAANTATATWQGVPTAINALPNNSDANFAIADWYNATAAPDFWVWRSSVTKSELVNTTSTDADGVTTRTFNWTGTGFITRSQGERDAFAALFNGTNSVNASLPQVRQAFADIFSGNTAPAPSNRTHLLNVARRKATRAEKLLAAGTGTAASPATMGFEGTLSYFDVGSARNS
jgi:hypothetical protein